MSAITVHLTPDAEVRVRHRASQAGQTVEAYVEELTLRAVTAEKPDGERKYLSDPKPTDVEFVRLLDALRTGATLPLLPADFSRADIYNEHD